MAPAPAPASAQPQPTRIRCRHCTSFAVCVETGRAVHVYVPGSGRQACTVSGRRRSQISRSPLSCPQFDSISANTQTYFLYIKAMQIYTWRQYPSVPPPLNVLSLPYNLLIHPLQTAVLALCGRDCRSSAPAHAESSRQRTERLFRRPSQIVKIEPKTVVEHQATAVRARRGFHSALAPS